MSGQMTGRGRLTMRGARLLGLPPVLERREEWLAERQRFLDNLLRVPTAERTALNRKRIVELQALLRGR